jgi:hypothetical protein
MRNSGKLNKFPAFFLVLLMFFIPFSTKADLSVTLPYTLNFDNNSWVSQGALEECGGTSTHVTSGCYSGGCMKVTPPTSPCTGGGINGGQTGIGWFSYSSTNSIHIRFLIKVGTTFASNVANGGGGLINKFILLDNPERVGILGFNGSDSDGRYIAFGALDNNEVYWFDNEHSGWIEYADLKVKDASRSNEWIAVEYWVNSTTDRTGIYIWTLDGTFNGSYVDIPSGNTSGSQGFYMSYFNSYGVADTNNYYMIDNLQISSSYIGPPDGFGSGGDTTPPAAPTNLSVS